MDIGSGPPETPQDAGKPASWVWGVDLEVGRSTRSYRSCREGLGVDRNCWKVAILFGFGFLKKMK